MDGGGPLTLTAESVERFARKLLPFLRHSLPEKDQISIYWIGIGVGEEAILLVKYFKANGIAIHIHGIELSRVCYDLMEQRIQQYGLTSSFTLILGDLLSFKPNFLCDIIYTSAAVNPTFNLKLLHVALACHAKWVFLSTNCTATYRREDLLEFKIESRLWTKAALSGSHTARNISIIFTHQFVHPTSLIVKSRQIFEDEICRRIRTDNLPSKWERRDRSTGIILTIFDVIKDLDGYLSQLPWEVFEIDNNTCHAAHLESRVVPQELRNEIKEFFSHQILVVNNVAEMIFFDLPERAPNHNHHWTDWGEIDLEEEG